MARLRADISSSRRPDPRHRQPRGRDHPHAGGPPVQARDPARREALDREIEESRKELRDQERRLEKRADLLDQKLELINRKEHEFESVQRFLAEQQEDLQRRQGEVKQILAEQRELLHRISLLSPEEARYTLLRQVEDELRGEVGS